MLKCMNVLASSFDRHTGYGRYAVHTIRALIKFGADVFPALFETAALPGWLARQAGFDASRFNLSITSAYKLAPLAGRQAALTMYETTRIPDEQVQNINKYVQGVIVPAPFLVDVFQESGVERPIYCVPGGIDADEFPILPKTNAERGRPFTFMALGDRGARKGWDTAWWAFVNAFGNREDVRFVVKARANNLREFDLIGSDKRISIWREDVDSMSDVFAQADCFVFPTLGEGYGLPPREAAASGLPVLCTEWGGTWDVEHWGIPLENYKMVDAGLEGGGKWAKPNVDELTQKMRWVYDNYTQARQEALQKAQWLRQHQTWLSSAAKLIAALERLGYDGTDE